MAKKLTLIAIAAVAAVSLWMVVGAGAHDRTIPSQLPPTLQLQFPDSDADTRPDSVTGKVTSPNQRCVARRTVKLYWNGNDGGGPQWLILIATDRTNKEGRWRLGKVEPIGRGGEVRLMRKNIGRDGHRHVCAGDKVPFD